MQGLKDTAGNSKEQQIRNHQVKKYSVKLGCRTAERERAGSSNDTGLVSEAAVVKDDGMVEERENRVQVQSNMQGEKKEEADGLAEECNESVE
jgi:hypothetical protein